MTASNPKDIRDKAARCRELSRSLHSLRDQAALNEFADVLSQQAADIEGETCPSAHAGDIAILPILFPSGGG